MIQNDPSIPLRSSKKTGAKSKKDLREQVSQEAIPQRIVEIVFRRRRRLLKNLRNLRLNTVMYRANGDFWKSLD